MSGVNNFDVLKKMSADNLDIRLGTDLLEMKSVRAGTKVTIGAPGNIVGQLFSGELVACLLIYNKKQFDETKKAMEPKPQEGDEPCGLCSSMDPDHQCPCR